MPLKETDKPVNARRNSKPSPEHQNGDNSTQILIGMVAVFLSCHFLRFLLQFYHHTVTNNYRQCVHNGVEIKAIPSWLWPLNAINHTCLVLNSSINFLLYCWLGSKFRSSLTKEVKNVFIGKRVSSKRERPFSSIKREQNGKAFDTSSLNSSI
jgi:hypothetical protein